MPHKRTTTLYAPPSIHLLPSSGEKEPLSEGFGSSKSPEISPASELRVTEKDDDVMCSAFDPSKIVHQKNASVLCLTTVKNEDKLDFSKLLEAIKANFNDKFDEVRKKWGGGILGSKSQAKTKAKERMIAKEATQRMN